MSQKASQAPGDFTVPAICGLLLLAVFLVFGQTVGHDFLNYDDNDYVWDNPHVSQGFSGQAFAWAITARYAANWHPLTWLSHIVDCQLYGLRPWGHHLTNLLLHGAAAVLLLLALRRMSGALWPSAWVAAVFAIHPLRVESVAWVAERKDVLSGLFCMLTLWLYGGYVQRGASWPRYLAVVASFALGLMAKPMLVTLPFVLLLLDYWPLGRASQPGRRWARLVVEKIPLFLLAAASCAMTLAAQRGAIRSLEQLKFTWRVGNAAVAYCGYLGKMLYPDSLAVLYPLPAGPPPMWKVAGACVFLAGISAAAFALRRKCPYLLFGWLWYLGTLVPVIGLVQVGDQAMADRYSYLTQIGLYAALAWGAAAVGSAAAYRRWGLAVASALTFAGLIVTAWQQTGHWRDSVTLWTHTVACTTKNSVAENMLGMALTRLGRSNDATEHFRKAVELDAGNTLARNNFGNALVERGQIEAAIAQYRKVLEIAPDNMEAHYNLGLNLARLGRLGDAVAEYQIALELKTDDAEVRQNLAQCLLQTSRPAAALDLLRQGLRNDPQNVGLLRSAAWILAACPDASIRNGAEAILLARKAQSLAGKDPQVLDTLAVAYAEAGQFAAARETAAEAVQIAEDGGNHPLAMAIRQQIDCFRAGKPWRDDQTSQGK